MTRRFDNPAHVAMQKYAAAVFAKDLDAFVALYDRNVLVFDAWDVRSYEGSDAWRGMTNEWFNSLGTDRVLVEFEDARVSVSASLAYGSAIVRFTAISASGQALRSLQNRITIVLALRDDEWKIVHQHTSSPINFETKQAISEVR